MLDAYKTNAGVTQTGNAQDFGAATAAYDRNAAAGRTAYEDAAGAATQQTNATNANNAQTYQAQMDEYQRQVQAQAQAQAEKFQKELAARNAAAGNRRGGYALGS